MIAFASASDVNWCTFRHSITQPAVKRFDAGVFHRLAWSNEVELDASTIRPIFEGARLKLGAVVDGDRPRDGRAVEDPI